MILAKQPKTTNFKTPALLLLHNLHSSSQFSHTLSHLQPTSKLLSNHFKLGRVEDAKKLFDEIPDRTVATWSVMIYGYATNGYHSESMNMFSNMRYSTIYPNSFTMVAVLVNPVTMQDIQFGRAVHCLIVKWGLEFDTVVGTSMLNMYAKCRHFKDSLKIFRQMKDPSLVSWNAMIAGFVYNESSVEAMIWFNQLLRDGLTPNSVTLLSVIRSCVSLESGRLCRSIHGFVVKTGLCSDLPVMNAVLDMYSNLEDLDSATQVFEKILFKDIISWTTMMGLLINLDYASKAIGLFERMREHVVNLDKLVIVNLATASALLGHLNWGRAIHTQALVGGFDSEHCVANSIVNMYAKCGDLCSSKAVFNRLERKSLVSWTTMISGCVQNGRPGEALYLLVKMRMEEEYELDPILWVSLLIACGELAALEPCQQIHCYLYKVGYAQYNPLQNSLISTYSKCGNVELADKVFREIGYRDIVSWNAIICGYGINGSGEAAVALFGMMRTVGMEPDDVTYLNVLSACSHSGLVDEGLRISDQMMKEKKVMLNGEHCGCIVDMLARSGRLSDASTFVSKLTERVGPNVWRALLGGCRIYNNVELAELAAGKVAQLDAEESGQVVLLSNVYASTGRFKDAEVLRSHMKLLKVPGISLLGQMT